MDKREAVVFLESLAKGFDPFTGEQLDEDSVLNEVRFVRKFYELRDFIVDNVDRDSRKKIPFFLKTKEGIITNPMTISAFVERINEVNQMDNMKKFTRTAIMDWLYDNGYLALDEDNSKYITEKGGDAGIYYDHRVSMYGKEYDVVVYPVSLMNRILSLIESGEIS